MTIIRIMDQTELGLKGCFRVQGIMAYEDWTLCEEENTNTYENWLFEIKKFLKIKDKKDDDDEE